METASPSQLLKPAQVQALTTLDRVTLWRKCRAGTFPQPLRISENRIAWRSSDIETWMSSCEPASDGEALH
jgi:prophage regulatory protein